MIFILKVEQAIYALIYPRSMAISIDISVSPIQIGVGGERDGEHEGNSLLPMLNRSFPI
jgi:hypothetical protein